MSAARCGVSRSGVVSAAASTDRVSQSETTTLLAGQLLLEAMDENVHQRGNAFGLAFGVAINLHDKLLAAVEQVIALLTKVLAALQEELDKNQVIQND